MASPTANERQIAGKHYGLTKFQHWDWVEHNGLGYLEGVATKYLCRHRSKDGVEGLQKSVHYIDKLLELYDTGRRNRYINRGNDTKTSDVCSIYKLTPQESVLMWNTLRWSGKKDLLSIRHQFRDLIGQYGEI